MVVLTQDKRPGVVGLHIGTQNVEQYFTPDMLLIELELDHLCILCSLEPSFWHDSPVIHDRRLSSWLDAKRTSGKLAHRGAKLAMIPSGKHSFRLQVVEGTSDEANQDAIPVIAMTERKPRRINADRRKVGKLRLDDSPTSAALSPPAAN